MNRLLISLVLLLSVISSSTAQESFTTHIDSSLRFLDKSRIQTGALYDRVMPWADLINYSSTDTVDYKFVRQAWYELYLSKYDRSSLNDVNYLHERVTRNNINNVGVSLGYIDFRLQYIDSNAIIDSALVLNLNDSLLRDGDLNLNPYRDMRITLPVISQATIRDAEPYFYFDPLIKLTNAVGQNSITEIEIDLAGKTLSISPGEHKSLDLSGITPGKYTARVTMHIGTRSISVPYLFDLFPHSEIMSATMEYCNSGDTTLKIWSGPDLTFRGYDEPAASQGYGEYKIFYKMNGIGAEDCGTKLLTKPLIFIDGFDPGDLRFIDEVNIVDGVTHQPIWEYMGYAETEHLADSLRLAGFDIIVLNFPQYKDPLDTTKNRDGGADYIERNAMLLTKLIQNVNDSLVANGVTLDEREIVIVGPSMGGQISRYALAYMEKQHHLTGLSKWNHNVNLWLSFDSPHHGANIPIGLQQFLYFFGYSYNDEFAKTKYEQQLRSAAARQMLIHQMDGINGTSSFFSTYYTGLESNGLVGSGGYPQNPRKVSLVNGTANGTSIGTPGANALDFTADARVLGINIDAAKVIIKNTESTTADVKTMDAYALKHLNPFLHVGYAYYTESTSSSIPVSNMSLQDKFIDMGLSVVGLPLHIKLHIYEADYFSKNITGFGSLDVMQGGQHDGIDAIASSLDEKLRAISIIDTSSIKAHTNQKTATFIPTVSALGFHSTNFDWAASFDDRNLVCTDEIPFDNYYFELEKNLDHVDLTNESAAWALEEILYGQPGCPTPCAAAISTTMPGTYMCGTDEYIFSIDVPFTAAEGSVEWTFSEGLVPVTGYISTNNNSIKLQWDGVNTPEERFVQARIIPKSGGTQCGAAKVLSLAVDYGEAFQLQLMPTRVTDPDFEMRVSSYHPTAYRYAWRDAATDPWPLSPTILYNRTFDKIPFDSTEVLSVRVYADGCPGYVSELSRTYIPIGLGWDEGDGPISWQSPTILVDAPTIAPNPTQDAWMLYLPQSWQATVQPLEITLVGPDGRTLHQTKTSTAKSQIIIPAAELASGVYIIRVQSGDKAYTLKAVKL